MSCRILMCGLLSLAVCTLTGQAQELWFGDPIQTQLPETPRDLAVGYLNGDSYQDVAFVTFSTSRLHVYFGDGSGSFTAGGIYTAGSGATWSLDIGDLNNDGSQDIATVDCASGFCRVHINDGSGGFPGPPLNFSNPRAERVRIGDLDEDEINDLVVIRQGSIAIHWGTESGPNPEPSVHRLMLSPQPECIFMDILEAMLVDLTGDGLVDIVALVDEYNASPENCGDDERGLGLLENLGGREYPAETEWILREPIFAQWWHDFAVSDLDNDEDLDVGIVGSNPMLRIFLNTGDGHLVEGEGLNTIFGLFVTFEDLNGDEKVDLAWSMMSPLAAVEQGDGEGGFTLAQMLAEPLRDIEAAEINERPGLDLIGYSNDVLTVLPNLVYPDPSSVSDMDTRLRPSLRVFPTIIDAGGCVIHLSLGAHKPATEPAIEIVDILGKRHATLAMRSSRPEFYAIRWRGVDDQGHRLPSGAYWIRALGIPGAPTAKVLMLK